MMKARGVVAGLVLMLALAVSAGTANAQAGGQPGQFDYYVLSLSWSPAYCATRLPGKAPAEQCTASPPFGFVVHGLWPQYERGGWPATCSTSRTVPQPIVNRMLPLMPSRGLINHQWSKHGTCSGLPVAGYFDAVAAARAGVTIPPALAHPAPGLSIPVAQVKAQLLESNPGLPPDGVAMVCDKARLSDVRVCLDSALAFRACGPDVRDACPGKGVLAVP